jgi:hypothetical protein
LIFKNPTENCDHRIKEFGCSVTPSSTVKTAIRTRGARNFGWFHDRKETLPWSCLVRCPQIFSHWSEKTTGIKHKDAFHKELPRTLSMLLNHPEEPVSFIDTNIFSREIEYRPRWVGVINNTENDNLG